MTFIKSLGIPFVPNYLVWEPWRVFMKITWEAVLETGLLGKQNEIWGLSGQRLILACIFHTSLFAFSYKVTQVLIFLCKDWKVGCNTYLHKMSRLDGKFNGSIIGPQIFKPLDSNLQVLPSNLHLVMGECYIHRYTRI